MKVVMVEEHQLRNAERVIEDLRAERDGLLDLIERLLPGWGSDEMGCAEGGYEAFEEARALIQNRR